MGAVWSASNEKRILKELRPLGQDQVVKDLVVEEFLALAGLPAPDLPEYEDEAAQS